MSHFEQPPQGPIPAESRYATREAWQAHLNSRRHKDEADQPYFQEPLTLHNADAPSIAYDALFNLIDATAKTEEEAEEMVEHIEAIKAAALGEQPSSEGNPFLGEEQVEFVDIESQVLSDPKVRELINSRDITASHQELIRSWFHFKETFELGIINGIEQGYIPSFAADRAKTALEQTSVRSVDGVMLGPVAAYYQARSDEIGVNHHKLEQGEDITVPVTHEIIHKLSGGTFAEDENGDVMRDRVGFSDHTKDGQERGTGVNEALTQHLTLGVLDGDFATIDPDERKDGNTIYKEYRKILATFIDRAGGVIDTKTLINSYFEDTESAGDITARKQLMQQVRQAYGPGAVHKLETLMGLTDMVNEDRFDEVILSRIHPAEVDSLGQVIKPGSIDVEELPTFFDLYATTQA